MTGRRLPTSSPRGPSGVLDSWGDEEVLLLGAMIRLGHTGITSWIGDDVRDFGCIIVCVLCM